MIGKTSELGDGAVLVTILLGACIPVALLGWNLGYQVDSGPLWFAVAFGFADRRLLPRGAAARTLVGFAAGVAVLAVRARGYGIESAPIVLVGLQLAVGLVEGLGWLASERELVRRRSRMIRERAAQIRFVNPLQRGTPTSERPTNGSTSRVGRHSRWSPPRARSRSASSCTARTR